jgi:hypothetical protein
MRIGEWRLRGDPTAGRTQAGGPLVVAVAGEGDRRADADDRREQRRRGEAADAKRRGEGGMGARVPGRGGALVVAVAGEDDRSAQRRRGEAALRRTRSCDCEGRGEWDWGLGFPGRGGLK